VSDKPKQTLDQQRAQHAYKVVESVFAPSKSEAEIEKFDTQAKKLPTRIIASGLGQGLAFLNAKQDAPALTQALDSWIIDERKLVHAHAPKGAKPALLLHIIHGDADYLRRVTDESLAYLQWLNRFVEAKVKQKENAKKGENQS